MSGLGDGRRAGDADAAAGPSNAPADVASASRPSSAAIEGRRERRGWRPTCAAATVGPRSRPVGVRRGRQASTGSADPVGSRQADREQPPVVDERQRASRAGPASPGAASSARLDERRSARRTPPAPGTRRWRRHDQEERHGEERRATRPAAQVGHPAREEAGPDRRPPRPRRRCARRRRQGSTVRAGGPGRRIERGEGEDDDPGVADDRVAEDVLEVVLDERRDARPGRSRRARCASTISRSGVEVDRQRRRPTRRSRRARRSRARPAPARSGPAATVSGTTSVRRAAHRWNGIAPKRIATAIAKAR